MSDALQDPPRCVHTCIRPSSVTAGMPHAAVSFMFDLGQC